MQLVPCRLAGTPVAAYGTLLGTLKLTLPSAREPLAFGPHRRMTRGFEEDRCTPLGAVALLYPLPRCRRPSQAVQIRSAVEFSLVAEELSSAGQPSGRRWISPLSHLWSLSDGASVRPQTQLQLFGNCRNQLPRLIEQTPQWLSGPSPLLPAAGPLTDYQTGSKLCSDALQLLFNYWHGLT